MDFIQVEAVDTFEHCLNHRRALLVVGSLDDVIEHRFARRKIKVIKNLVNYLEEDDNNLNQLLDHLNEVRAIVLVVESEEQRNQLPNSIVERIDFFVKSQQREREECWTWCIERHQAASSVDMTRVSQTNNDTDFECCSWCLPQHSLFHCMYDGDMGQTDKQLSVMHTDCRERCMIEESPIEEHRKRGVCKKGETFYEKFGYSFQTEDEPATFNGKVIR